MSLRKTLYPLLSTSSTQEALSRHYRKIVDWDVKNQHKQTYLSTSNDFRNVLGIRDEIGQPSSSPPHARCKGVWL